MPQNIIDIHCHWFLKRWIFDSHHIYDTVTPMGDHSLELSYYTLDTMQDNVNVAVSAHYLPERELLTELDGNLLQRLGGGLVSFFLKNKVARVLEDKSTPTAAFSQMVEYMERFEKDVTYASDVLGKKVAIARSFDELETLLGTDTSIFLQSIEGAHVLGNEGITEAGLEASLMYFYHRGICQITLGHFFQNMLVSSSGGIPPSDVGLINYDFKKYNTFPNGYNEELAPAIISKILDIGIVIDLVHCHSGAKKMIFELNKARGNKKRPLVFSHTGLQSVVTKHDTVDRVTPPDYLNYGASDDDIAEIQACNGVLGIIFMRYWLTGDDNHDPCTAAVIESIQHIKFITGTYNNIALGTDLDGYTTIPKDLLGPRSIPGLVDEIRKIDGITTEDVNNMCYGNYIRVLKTGWGVQD